MKTPSLSRRLQALTFGTLAGVWLAAALMWGLNTVYAQATSACLAEYTGDNTPDFSSSDASAVRNAIAAAPANGVVKIAGTCAGAVLEEGTTQVALITKTLTLRGGYTSTNWNISNPALNPTTLDAQGGGRVLYISVAATVEGFTVTNGFISGDGAGIFALEALTLTNMTAYSNTASASGGAAYILGSGTITGSAVRQNTAQYGGGVSVFGPATLTNTTFVSNTAQVTGGGGVFSALTLTGSSFRANQAQFGGGLSAFGVATLTTNSFISNTAQTNGGGADFNGGGNLIGNSFLSNTAQYGGGVSGFGATLVLSTNVFTNNTAQFNGGGVYLNNGGALVSNTFSGNAAQFGGGVLIFGTGALTSNTFFSNTAQFNGGGADLNGASTLLGNTFTSNTAQFGGGLRIGSDGLVTSDVLSGNIAQYGGGAYFTGTMTLSNTLFSGNQALSGGGGAIFQGVASIQQSQFLNNRADDGLGLGTGGAVQLDTPTAQLTVQQTQFTNNRALGFNDDGGGAIMVYAGSLTVTRSALVGNGTLGRGGALSVAADTAGQLSFENTLLAGNTANSGGQAVSLRTSRPLQLVHTTVASPTVASGPAIEVISGTLSLTNTLVASHTVGIAQTAGTVTENYTLFSGVATPYSGTITAGPNSITGTAAFIAPASGNYRLNVGSTAINTGVNAGVSVDYDGDTRPQGGGFDIGYDEYTTVTNTAPLANAGPDQTVAPSALVTLNGSASSDPDGNTPLTYGWVQTGGLTVTLSSSTLVTSTFTAPASASVLTFTLTVTDALGLADPTPDTVVITVTPQSRIFLPFISK